MTNAPKCGVCQSQGRDVTMDPVPGLPGVYRHTYIDDSGNRHTHELTVEVEQARLRPPLSVIQLRRREKRNPDICPFCERALQSGPQGPFCPPGKDRHPFTYRPGMRPPWMPTWGRLGGKVKGGGSKAGRKRKKPKRKPQPWEM